MASPQSRATTTTITLQPPTAALLIYPATLLLGSLFSVVSPTAQPPKGHTEPFMPSLAADVNLPENTPDAINYFARKDNVFNAYFVKIGWFWTTLAFLSLLPQLQSSTQRSTRRLSQALARYALATLFWYLTTQWFFGPGIIDRGFVVTGGRCERASWPHLHHRHGDVEGEGSGLEELFTGAACKAAGGHWRGGHDVSGHVFMLVLATALLVFEGVGMMKLAEQDESGGGSVKDKADGSGECDDTATATGRGVWARRVVWGVAGLGWWMLLMTAIWFHTWLEKVSCSTSWARRLADGFSGLVCFLHWEPCT